MLRIKSFVNKYILLQAFVIAITACLASINTESFHMSPCAGATIAAQKQSHHDCGMLQHRRCYNYTYDIIHIAGVINKNKPDQYVRGLLITWVTWVQLFVFIQQLSDKNIRFTFLIWYLLWTYNSDYSDFCYPSVYLPWPLCLLLKEFQTNCYLVRLYLVMKSHLGLHPFCNKYLNKWPITKTNKKLVYSKQWPDSHT